MMAACHLFFWAVSVQALLVSSSSRDLDVPNDIHDVTLRIHGKVTAESPLVICLPGKNPDLVYEWSAVAGPLAKAGYAVVIVNTKNARFKPAEMLQFIDQHILKHPEIKKEKYVLMGKSMGGGLAIEIALQDDTKILKLALIAPASASELMPKILDKATLPVYLGWASDDPIIKSWDVARWRSSSAAAPKSVFVTKNIPKGGHVVNDEYSASILAFIRGE